MSELPPGPPEPSTRKPQWVPQLEAPRSASGGVARDPLAIRRAQRNFALGAGVLLGAIHGLGFGLHGMAGPAPLSALPDALLKLLAALAGPFGLGLPIVHGILAAGRGRRIDDAVVRALQLSLWSIAAALPLMLGGLVCLIVIVPYYLLAAPATALLITAFNRFANVKPREERLLGLLLLVGAGAAILHGEAQPAPDELFTDSVVIAAPREAVWASIDSLHMEFEARPSWLLRLGLLPLPLRLVGGGASVGAERRVIFSNGTVLAKVTSSTPPARFAFQLSVEESGPEFFDHWSTLGESAFELEPLPGGRTRVRHSTRYAPHNFPRWYFRPIERLLGREVQRYMLEAYAAQVFGMEVAAR